MNKGRACGILLHPSSFPGPHGIGDLGKEAYDFIDFLEESGQTLWQVLPLGPTGYGDSPYASFSSFAGNPLLIDLDELVKSGDLTESDLKSVPDFPAEVVDYGWVIYWKLPLLEKAAKHFLSKASATEKADFDKFCGENYMWLEDYSLFMAVKSHFDKKALDERVSGAMWSNYWDKDIALRQPEAVDYWKERCAAKIAVRKVWQYYFFKQWSALKRYANKKKIEIIGDIPIFVAPDSVDVWADRELFHLDKEGRQTVSSGVPPDYFSDTGQLWGNPLYNWDAMKKNGYKWWINRIRAVLKFVDIIRIDHFRGFEAYWEVSAGETTAVHGNWKKAPGIDLFNTVKKELGELPILAEDLGVITPEVVSMRDKFDFPGMKVLQFAFDARESGGINSDNAFLPHNHSFNSVVYTGTHDNDTTLGWYRTRGEYEKDMIRRYLARDDNDIVWDFIRMALSSVSRFAVIQMQDILCLETAFRMNTPSTLGGNWTWRLRPDSISGWHTGRLKEMTHLYGRFPV